MTERNFDNALMWQMTERIIPVVRDALDSHPPSRVVVSLAGACIAALGGVSRPPARNAAP